MHVRDPNSNDMGRDKESDRERVAWKQALEELTSKETSYLNPEKS